MRSRLLPVMLVLLCCAALQAGDWPQWRGPNRDGVAQGERVTTTWPLKTLWKKEDIGKSISGLVVSRDVLVLHYREGGQEVVRALDAASGADLWKHAYDQPLPAKMGRGYGDCPRSTPAIADGVVYTLGYAGKLYAADLKTGRVLWHRDLFADFKHDRVAVKDLNFGVTASPLVTDGKVFIPQGTWAKWRMLAIDAKTGKDTWKALEKRGPAYSSCYASPILFRSGDARVVFCESRFFSIPDGTVLGRTAGPTGVATPVQIDDMILQVHGPANAQTVPNGGLHKVSLKDGKFAVKEVWRSTVLGIADSTAVVRDGHVYAHLRGRGDPGKRGFKCVELLTGKEKWCRTKDIDRNYVSLILIGEQILLTTHRGELILIDATPDGYHERARMKPLGKTYVHPAIANGTLYLRDDQQLMCLDLGGH